MATISLAIANCVVVLCVCAHVFFSSRYFLPCASESFSGPFLSVSRPQAPNRCVTFAGRLSSRNVQLFQSKSPWVRVQLCDTLLRVYSLSSSSSSSSLSVRLSLFSFSLFLPHVFPLFRFSTVPRHVFHGFFLSPSLPFLCASSLQFFFLFMRCFLPTHSVQLEPRNPHNS